jgi:hypothetical protein
MEAEACTPSHAQAIKLKAFAKEGKIAPDFVGLPYAVSLH